MIFLPAHVQIPKTSSEDQLASITEELVAKLQKSHPLAPYLNQGTETNDAIRELQKLFHQQQKDTSPRVTGDNTAATRVQQKSNGSPRVAERLTIIKKEPHEIGTKIMKKFKNKLYRGIITDYYRKGKQYLVNYKDGDKEIMSHRQSI